MTSITRTANEQLIKRVTLAFLAQVILISIHHIYGGLIYEPTLRLSQPIFAAAEFLIVLSVLFWFRRTKSKVALTLFSVLIALVGVVQGLFHTLYGHTYKDLLFLIGIPAERVRHFFSPMLPNDFIYPPNHVFFEATGLLELATIYLLIIFTYRLIRNRQGAE